MTTTHQQTIYCHSVRAIGVWMRCKQIEPLCSREIENVGDGGHRIKVTVPGGLFHKSAAEVFAEACRLEGVDP
jgi:hypothetical protein